MGLSSLHAEKSKTLPARTEETYLHFSNKNLDELFELETFLRGMRGICDSKPDISGKDRDWFYLQRLCEKTLKKVHRVSRALYDSASDFERKPTVTPGAAAGVNHG